ncbi:MAG: MurR/RpiR family transcriptional regulator [Spirochaetales bacterium]|nr:MurR/RpiR family transcriptional regulator [Spirochaetales bacterium]
MNEDKPAVTGSAYTSGSSAPAESILTTIRTRYHTLSDVQKSIADYVLANSSEVMLHSISDIAARCSTSETTIMRFIRKLGYKSYQVFRVQIAQATAGEKSQTVFSEIESGDSIGVTKQKIISSTVNSIRDMGFIVSDRQIEEAVGMLTAAKRIIFIGVGASAFVMGDMYHKFARLGFNAVKENDPHIMAILGTHTGKSDCLVCISHSGESKDILDALNAARQRGCRTIGITSYANSTLAANTDITLLSSSNETRYRPDAMVSRIIQLVIVDILTIACTFRLGKKGIAGIEESQLAVAGKKR